MDIVLTIVELSLLVLAGLASATYAKSEGAKRGLAAGIGVGVAVLIYLLATKP